MIYTDEEMVALRVGYCEDWTGAATQKVVILAETTDGRYVLRRYPVKHSRPWYGSEYWSDGPGGIFLRPKNEVQEGVLK